MIDGLRPNDRVITTAGTKGRLVGRNKDLFLVEVAPEVRFEIEGSKIESVVERGQPPALGRASQRAAGTTQPSRSGRQQEPVRDNQGGMALEEREGTDRRRRNQRSAPPGRNLEGGDRFCGECGREVRQ
jgi:hypothetical protein